MQENLKQTLASPGLTEDETAASELADLIEEALEWWRPDETDWVDVLDDLWRVEVKGYKPPTTADDNTPDAKDDPVIRNAQKARRVLGCPRKPGRPSKGDSK
jgi:hypothetical protein